MTNTEPNTIHLLLQKMREEIRGRFDQIDDRFTDMETRFDALESVFAGLSYINTDARSEIAALKARVEKLEVL